MQRRFAQLFVLAGLMGFVCATANAQAPQTPVEDKLAAEDLDELLGPIALYPDTLLANVVAACIYPDEVAAAHKFVKGNADPAALETQGWEPAVVAVARVPDVLDMLAESPEWTAAIGQAYLVQSAEMMAAVQRLRAKANQNGILASNENQTVVQDGSTIIIETPKTEVVYVPTYDPAVVYAPYPPPYYGPTWGQAAVGNMISFGVGVAVGAAFDNNDCDWGGGGICHGDVDIDREVNIETGDINVGSNNTRNTERTNNSSRTNTQNNVRAGDAGTAFKPNQQKVAKSASGRTNTEQMQQFKGASKQANAGAANAQIPNRGKEATAARAQSSGAARTGDRAGASAGGASAQNRGGTAGDRSGSGSAAARDGTRSTPKPTREAKPGGGKPPSKSPSGLSGSKSSGAARDRGSSSRSSSGGGSRGGGGGGGRGGGGRGGGGGGRR